MGATAAIDGTFSWILRLFGAAAETSEVSAEAPNPLVRELLRQLRPVYAADSEAVLWAALDACAPDVLRVLEASPSHEGGERDTYVRARVARGFEGEDAERFEAVFAMFLFCRDATQARRELGGEGPESFDMVQARANTLSEEQRAPFHRAVRGVGAFAAIAIAARCTIDLQPWQRRALLDVAWDVSRLGVAEGVADLQRRGAIPILVTLIQYHKLFFPLPALREAVLDELAEREEADPQRRSAYARLFDRIKQAENLPTYVGDHAELFREVTQTAQAHMIALAAEDWCSGQRASEEILRSLGLLAMDLMVVLDADGAGRAVDQMRLRPPARAAILARLRADRLARNGAPRPDTTMIARDVAASQRIEGVDVRPLLYLGRTVGRG